MPSINKQDDLYEVNSVNSITKKTVIKKRKFFPTKRGMSIVNAVSGYEYPWTQGSFDEKRLFKVIDSTAYYDEKGVVRHRTNNNIGTPNLLYFDSPEQYMMHMRQKIAHNKLMAWHDNVRRLFPEDSKV